MTNRKAFEKVASRNHLGTISNYPEKIDSLNYDNRKKLIDVLDTIGFGESTDVDVFINRVPHVIEISFYDAEEEGQLGNISFNILTKDSYIDRYGDDRYYS